MRARFEQAYQSFIHQGPCRRERQKYLPRAGCQDGRREERRLNRGVGSFGLQRRRRLCP